MDIELLLSEWEPHAVVPHSEDSLEDDSDDEHDEQVFGDTEGVDNVDERLENDGRIYVETLARNGGITLLQESKEKRAYRTKGILGLFALFFSRRVRDTLLQWLTPRLIQSGVPIVSLRELNAYIGLEIATSLCPLNRLRDYSSTNDLYGHHIFRSTMQRDLLLGIRAALTLHPIDTVSEEVKTRDPLWHCRSILNNILKKCASLAVPNGVSALDESSIRTKARSAARTYIPSKPDKYAVRFYALVDWKTLYVRGLFDNGSGNRTVSGHLERYTAVFPELRRSMAARCDNCELDATSATELWVAMLAKQNQQLLSPKAAILELKDAARGSWKLVAAIDTADNLKDLEKAHKQSQKNLKKAQKTPFVPPRHRHISSDEAFCAYNSFMNAVDRFDQMRSTNPIRRRKRRLTMSIFTWLLDVAIHNAFVIYPIIERGNGVLKSIRSAKEEIVNRLVTAQQQHMQSLRQRTNHREPIEDIIGSDSSQHMLTRSRSKLLCRLCAIRGGKNRVKYACTRCRLGYHVECFMAVHYKHMMTENAAVMEALDAVIMTTSGIPKVNKRQRQNTSIIEPHEIELPRLLLKDSSPRQRKRARIRPVDE
ncbi:Hypothetical protein PHPALM_36271 [Phytophthora palmivora]|uniref:PiggyBac transposable element-derived protein domain-containing protein n=1 Tax=Phytophthora palmivora TaxID=4796 RepID=A0A2P4X0D6_9STRA|nr:Hypothetical protein PHPALM_36271 [Phytophthora palmivora]